jgi:ATP-dependent RNA helicase RhlE
VLDEGYTKPTPIQAQAIPLVISGKDIMGGAQTGTGKTAAFTLPILQRILPFASSSPSPAKHPVRALILAPTRELAMQVFESVKSYSKHTPIRAMCAYGGVDIKPQIAELKKGVEILVATPAACSTTSRTRASASIPYRRWSSTKPTACSTWASSPMSRAS